MNRSRAEVDARKRQLILEGQLYRLEVLRAKNEVAAGMAPKALAKDAFSQVGSMAATAGGKLLFKAGVAKGLIPLGMAGLSAWRRLKAWRATR